MTIDCPSPSADPFCEHNVAEHVRSGFLAPSLQGWQTVWRTCTHLISRDLDAISCATGVFWSDDRLESHLTRSTPFGIPKDVRGIVRVSVPLAFFLWTMPAFATIVLNVPGSERTNITRWIAVGKTPIAIRAVAISDTMFVSAILRGSKTRQISILVDDNSAELRPLLDHKNVLLRISNAKSRGRFGRAKLRHSLIMEIGGGFYQTWDGPANLTRNAFGPHTQFVTGSGNGPWEPFRGMAQTFDRDFSRAMTVQQPL